MKTSDYIVQFLVEHGIKHCYGYQGTMIAHLVDSIGKCEQLNNHVCYNEQGAALAAVGEAKISGEVTFAYSTSGPGAANLLNGVADAFYDSVPVIFITGQLNTNEYLEIPQIRQHGFQQMDVVSVMKPVTKYCEKVENENDLKWMLEKAYYMATEGRPGPVLLDIPMNMQRMEIDPDQAEGYEIPKEDIDAEREGKIAGEILTALKKAKRPVLMLGNGIDRKNRKTVRKMVDQLGIPVVTSMLGRDILPWDHMLNFGYLGAAYGHRYANMIVHKKADLIVALGCSLCKRQTGMKTEQFAENADIIRIDIDPVELQRKVHANEIGIVADCNKVIETIDSLNPENLNKQEWVEVCTKIKTSLEWFDDSLTEREPNKVIRMISHYTQEASVIACDVGQHQMWGTQSYELQEGQRLICSGGHGCMGFSLPAAIGAYYATGKPVIAIVGDGSLQMNIQELQWIQREQIPITLFVMNNHTLGLISQQQDSIFDGRYIASMVEGGYTVPDFAAIASAYKIHAERAMNQKELGEILENLDLTRPNLIDIALDVKSRAYPKTSFGEEIHNQQPYMPKMLMSQLLEL